MTRIQTLVLPMICITTNVFGQSNIATANKFAWCENVGWTNWRDANGAIDGVIVGVDYLDGFIWSENVGWLNVGDGSPANGVSYTNAHGLDFGVNIGLDGDLAGLAWGENAGWINFGWGDASNDPNRARFDFGAGRFRGYAWGENTGWINLDDATQFVGVMPDAPEPPIEDSSNLDKTRFVSFVLPATNSGETAVRVRLTSLHHVVPPYSGGPSVPFTSLEGQVRWVGPPTQYVESASSGTPFLASQLQCAPHYQDWSTVGLLHVTGSAIVPSSLYEVEHLAASCAGAEAGCAAVSAPLAISTTRWGDVETPFNPPSATVQPDVADIGALVNKFRSAPGAPIKARAFLAGAPGNAFGEITHPVLDVDFGFSHISACVDAFRGVPYPYTVQACP